MAEPMKVLAICGSLRKGSYNRMALNHAIAHAPKTMTVTIAEIGDLPLYNEDVRLAGPPAAVTRLKDQVRDADALLFVTPEYNYSMPGVLKNAIDWVSRPPAESPFKDKPCAMMGASLSLMGTVRSQLALRQTCLGVGLIPMGGPEVMIAQADHKFAEDGTLKDEKTGTFIAQLMAGLETWAWRWNAPAPPAAE